MTSQTAVTRPSPSTCVSFVTPFSSVVFVVLPTYAYVTCVAGEVPCHPTSGAEHRVLSSGRHGSPMETTDASKAVPEETARCML